MSKFPSTCKKISFNFRFFHLNVRKLHPKNGLPSWTTMKSTALKYYSIHSESVSTPQRGSYFRNATINWKIKPQNGGVKFNLVSTNRVVKKFYCKSFHHRWPPHQLRLEGEKTKRKNHIIFSPLHHFQLDATFLNSGANFLLVESVAHSKIDMAKSELRNGAKAETD